MVLLNHPEDEDAPYDGISEFWFDDRSAFDSAITSPEAEATLADAVTFLMPPRIPEAVVHARLARRDTLDEA